LLVPGIASASSATRAENRVWAFDLVDQVGVGVERSLTLELHRGSAPTYDDLASDSRLAAKGGVGEGTKVYRVWGDGAAANGRLWTTVNPGSVPNYQGAAVLPSQNTGRFVSEGVIQDATGITTRSSLPLGGNPGGLPEVLIPNPASQVRLTGVSGMNPPF
jgi:hypothetical protein